MEGTSPLEKLIQRELEESEASSFFAYNSLDRSQSYNPENRELQGLKKDQFSADTTDYKCDGQNDQSRYQTARIKDKCKTIQNSPKHGYSNSYTLTPKGHQFNAKDFKNGSDQEDSESNYQELTLKLQKALNKISFSGKGMNKSISHHDDIYKRSQLCAERKKKELQKKRKESQIEKLKQIRPKPVINKNSQKIVKETGHEPIYLRFQKIVQDKKKRIEQTEQSKRREKEQEENLFLEELNRYMKRPNTTRTYSQYYSQMMRWKQKKDEQNKQKFEEAQRKQIQSAPFKPTLNSKSKQIAAEQNRLPIAQREVIKKKVNPEYTFHPKISRKP